MFLDVLRPVVNIKIPPLTKSARLGGARKQGTMASYDFLTVGRYLRLLRIQQRICYRRGEKKNSCG